MRKAAISPTFEIYLQNADLDDQVLSLLLKGHLVIEALTVELLQLQVKSEQPWNWSFPKKTDKLVEMRFISDAMKQSLDLLNEVRNDCTHILGHKLSFDQIHNLVCQAAKSGFDFSDETIFLDKNKAEQQYGTAGSLVEVLNAFFFDLAQILCDQGGPDRRGG